MFIWNYPKSRRLHVHLESSKISEGPCAAAPNSIKYTRSGAKPRHCSVPVPEELWRENRTQQDGNPMGWDTQSLPPPNTPQSSISGPTQTQIHEGTTLLQTHTATTLTFVLPYNFHQEKNPTKINYCITFYFILFCTRTRPTKYRITVLLPLL